MEIKSRATIISCNMNSEAVCASAARISTTKGNAIEIFENARSNPRNQELIKKVMQSGHNSFIEHAVFTIAFSNVSVLVEQSIIEFRLASYTVKSRRYVDFGKMGYYTPEDLCVKAKTMYRSHMDFLFGEYDYFVSNGTPKEDARFVLPYSFLSNFYCTVNARELLHVLTEVFGGRRARYRELVDLCNQICDQLNELFPCIRHELDAICGKNGTEDVKVSLTEISDEPIISKSGVDLVNYSDSTKNKYFVDYFDSGSGKALGKEIPRLHEFITASFIIRDLSLAGLTHLVRHRIQSIIIPPIWCVDANRFLVPASIANSEVLSKRFFDVVARNVECRVKLREYGFRNEMYLALSGNTMDVITSMNARELDLFFKLRCCSRAQWEIRGVAIDMLHKLRDIDDELFSGFGPSCYADGQCPEGQLGCGNSKSV